MTIANVAKCYKGLTGVHPGAMIVKPPKGGFNLLTFHTFCNNSTNVLLLSFVNNYKQLQMLRIMIVC